MKKFFSIFLAMIIISSFALNVFATEPELKFILTCNGSDVVIKEYEDIITVTYTIVSNTDFDIETIANEISYSSDFFRFEGFESNPLGQNTSHVVTLLEGPQVLFNAGVNPAVKYSANQLVGTFKLKIIAESGSSVVRSVKQSASYGNKNYKISVSDLTVKIGNAAAPDTCKLTFETNGGWELDNVIRDKDAVINLSGYTTEKENSIFEGWYLDEQLTNKAPDTITLNANTTLYAKWQTVVTGDSGTGDSGTGDSGTGTGGTGTGGTGAGGTGDSGTGDSGTGTGGTGTGGTGAGGTGAGGTGDSGTGTGGTGAGGTGAGGTGAGGTGAGGTGAGGTGAGGTGTGDTGTGGTATGNTGTGSTGTGGGGVTRYTLSFETDGGKNIDSVSKVRNTTVDLSKYITEKTGYSFDGWFTDKELTNKVSSVKMTSNITLYAKWVKGDNGYVSKPNYKPDIFASEHNAYIVGREGGYIAPDENLTRAEAATIFFRLLDGQVLIEGMTKKNSFTDVNEGDWFNTAVSTLTNLGVLTGRTNDTFAPDALITRAEFMTIVARLSEAQYEGEDLFVDIAGHWAKEYINIAASIKWANGYGVIFKPDISITRAEAFTIVNRATNRLPESTADLIDGMITFVDNNDVNAWYYINIQEATNSHNFEIKSDGIHEKWTKLNTNPNWSDIEN